MRTTTLVILNAVTCANCGCVFGLSADHEQRLRDSRKSFYCPNGHSLSFGESEADRLRRRAERAETRNAHLADQLEGAERSRRATRGHLTRLKNRIAAGACPCCHERFPDLAGHMADEHPGYGEEG